VRFADRKPIIVLALLTCALLFPAAEGRSQHGTVTGVVVDSVGTPLIGANVVVKGTVLGAMTDVSGTFLIRHVPSGRQTLIATMLGYEKAEIAIDSGANTARMRIVLRETPILTDEVVVTASRRGQSFDEVPVSIALFEGRQIEQRALIALDQALRYIPGVNMTESQINIRGSSGYSRALGSRVLMLLDGVPMLAGDANEVKHDAVPMYMIERIEVVKGAGSALYGSSALGGVINIITREPFEASTRIRVYSGFYGDPQHDEWKWWQHGPRLFHGLDVQHGNARKDFRYLVSGGVRTQQSYRQKDDFIRFNLNGKATWKPTPESQLIGTLNHAYDDHGNWVYWRDINHALMAPEGSDLTERLRSTKTQGTVQYRATLSPAFAQVARLSWYRTAFDMRSDTSDFSMRPTDKTQSRADVIGAEWQGTLALQDRQTLVFGVDASSTNVASSTYGDRTAMAGAIYAQNDFAPLEGLNLSTGARFDFSHIAGADAEREINPRLGVSWTPVHGTILRASYGWGFRSASIAERFATASAGGILTKPNPNLRSERSTSYEVGVKQELPIPAVLDAAVFLSDYENLVEPIIDVTDGRIVFRNITRARISGLEVGLLASLWPQHADLSVGYTFMYPQDRLLGDILKYRPRHLLYVSGSFSFGAASVGIDFRHVSRIEAIDRELELIIRDADQRVGIYVTDVRCAWDFQRQGIPLSATFSIDNLFQYNYTEIVGNIAPIRNFKLTLETAL
jgi:outer membrane receptor for ferrienterochelin and colicins